MTGSFATGGGGEVALRPARPDDLDACLRLWRDAINDYVRRLGQRDIPGDSPGPARLHAHTLATDPERFWVATRRTADGEQAVGFGSAAQRGKVWFLSMLFVDPAEQGRGVGRRLLEAIWPSDIGGPGDGVVLATAADSAQPISNALYASLGIVPRVPLLNFIGRPRVPGAFPSLPGDVAVERLDDPVTVPGSIDAEIDRLDRELLGFDHQVDHAYVRGEPRSLFLFRRGRSGELAGYGYAGLIGRVGPIAVRDPGLLAAAVGTVLNGLEPRGASSIWVAGSAGDAVASAFRAGLRTEDFPLLLCWSRQFADFSRYVPMWLRVGASLRTTEWLHAVLAIGVSSQRPRGMPGDDRRIADAWSRC